MKGKFAPNGLEAAMKRRGLSSVKLAEAAGTKRQTINKLAAGERELTVTWAEQLAGPLGISPEELLFPDLKPSRVPLFSWVSAGRLTAQDGVKHDDARGFIATGDLPKGDWIALEVQGDSMNRISPDGSYIFVNRADKRLVDEGFYVFATPDGETVFKRFRSGHGTLPDRLQPFSTNPDHETRPVSDGMKVVGRVGRVIIDLSHHRK